MVSWRPPSETLTAKLIDRISATPSAHPAPDFSLGRDKSIQMAQSVDIISVGRWTLRACSSKRTIHCSPPMPFTVPDRACSLVSTIPLTSCPTLASDLRREGLDVCRIRRSGVPPNPTSHAQSSWSRWGSVRPGGMSRTFRCLTSLIYSFGPFDLKVKSSVGNTETGAVLPLRRLFGVIELESAH